MLRNVKRSAIRMASTALDATGLLSGVSNLRLRNKCVVLTYHRVIEHNDRPKSSSHPGIIVSRDNFATQMKFVANHLYPMTLDSFEHHLKERMPFPSGSCLITFDDGWLDNYEVAFPILKTHRIPATVFLPVDYISSDKMFWQEELFMRLSAQHEDDARQHTRAHEIRQFVSSLKQGNPDAIERELDAARSNTADLDFRGHYNRYLSWTQVAEMLRNGISFGSHACSHRILCNLSEDEQLRELTESKRILEEKLDRPVTALAYPNGDFDSNVIKHAKAAGYTIAFSTIRGFCGAASDKFAIPRVNLHDYNAATIAMFRSTLLGLI